jgi:hypothetical protein
MISNVNLAIRQDVQNVIYNAYRQGFDNCGLDPIRELLRKKGIRLQFDDSVLSRWDNDVRKRLEAEGFTVVNPTARNGGRRSITGTDIDKHASLITRDRITRTRQRRDDQQHQNLLEHSTDPMVRKANEVWKAKQDVRAAQDREEEALEELLLGFYQRQHESDE